MTELGAQDRAELEALVSAYAAAVDAHDWDVLSELFTADAVLRTPEPPGSLQPLNESRGRAAILAQVRSVAAFARTEHLVLDHDWLLAGDTATGRTRGEAHHVVDGPEPHSWVWHLEYHDQCIRTAEGWRFASRDLSVRTIEKRRLG